MPGIGSDIAALWMFDLKVLDTLVKANWALLAWEFCDIWYIFIYTYIYTYVIILCNEMQ